MTSALMQHSELRIQSDSAWLDAYLTSSPESRGLILCALPHLSQLRASREDAAGECFRRAGFATLLVSLLTPYEAERDPDLRYDVALFDLRLQHLLLWIARQPALGHLPRAILASDCVLAAAIRLLAREPDAATALVSRAGRADLAGAQPLRRLQTPLLMLIDGSNADQLRASEQAFALLQAPKARQNLPADDDPAHAAPAACAWFAQHIPAR